MKLSFSTNRWKNYDLNTFFEIAKEYKFRALQNSEYANKQYALDMSRERLYAETDRRMR